MHHIVNRALLIVKAKQAFVDWVNKHDDEVAELTIEEINKGDTVYLVREYFEDTEQEDIIKEHHEKIFEEKLNGWTTDESLWPKTRDLKSFREWFNVEFHSMVIDLEDNDYMIEEYEI